MKLLATPLGDSLRSRSRTDPGLAAGMDLGKLKVEIPPALGRTLYGIMDETGTLSYGQVFVQYSVSIANPQRRKRSCIQWGVGRLRSMPLITRPR